MVKGIFAALALVLMQIGIAAADPADRGPAIGAEVDFVGAVKNAQGAPVALADLHGDAGTVLVFSRSLDWCPFCKKQASDLIENADVLTELGYTIAVMTYDAPAKLTAFKEKNSGSFPLLSDSQSQNIIALGLLNEKYEPGSFAYGIPHPIIIVLNPDNEVIAKFAEDGYKDRPAIEQVAQTLKSLAG